ncbi:MAG: M16 family metallopeptidase, partial [Gemmatimonadota bacterium]
YGTWWERLPALCFPPDHPFHHSLIGSMEDLTEASLEDVAAFFRTYYTPDNAVLTIAGDFDPIEARQLVERHFGEIPRGTGRPALPDMSLPPTFGGRRREVVEDAVVAPRLFLAFRIPPAGDDAWYAVYLLSAVLGSGEACRLETALVRDQAIATSANAYTYDLTKGSDLLVIDVTARPGVDPTALEAAVEGEVDRMIAEGVGEAECRRALALLETAWVAELQSAGSRADALSTFATYHDDPTLLNAELARYAAVSAEEVTVVARRYLVAETRATLLYVPQVAEVAA